MRKFRVTYQPFSASDATSSDIIVPAISEAQAKTLFQQHWPQYTLIRLVDEGAY